MGIKFGGSNVFMGKEIIVIFILMFLFFSMKWEIVSNDNRIIDGKFGLF